MNRTPWLWTLPLLAGLCACDEFDPPAAGPPAATIPGGDAAIAQGEAPAGPAVDSPEDPSAEEGNPRLDFTLAQGSQDHVWILNSREHGVTVIDARTLEIQQGAAGTDPAYFATHPDGNAAIVIDAAASRAFVFHVSKSALDRTVVDIAPHANAVAMAPDGRHAILYESPEFFALEPVSAASQEITVISLGDKGSRAARVTVGVGPRQIRFASDGDRAMVVTSTGISVIDIDAVLDGDTAIAVPTDFGPDLDFSALRVQVARDGSFALGYEPGSQTLHWVQLDSGDTVRVEMGDLSALADENADAGGPVDLGIRDVALSNGDDFAIVTMPGDERVLFAQLPGVFEDADAAAAAALPDPIPELVTLSDNRAWGLIFSPQSDRVALIDLVTPNETQPLDLAAEPTDAEFFPDSAGALLRHMGDDAGYSVLDVASGFIKYRATSAPPGAHSYATSAKAAFVLVRDDAAATHEVHQVTLDGLEISTLELDSPPTAVGFIPGANRIFVNQEHIDGRVSFIDLEDANANTLTGVFVPDRVQE